MQARIKKATKDRHKTLKRVDLGKMEVSQMKQINMERNLMKQAAQ